MSLHPAENVGMEGFTAPVALRPAVAAVRTYRYRLLLTARQHGALERILESQRLLYNGALQERADAWRKAKVSINRYDQCRSLTLIRADDADGYGAIPVSLSRATLRRLDEAFKGFFRRVKAGQTPGFPRFKPMSRWDSFGFSEFSGIRFDGRRLRSGTYCTIVVEKLAIAGMTASAKGTTDAPGKNVRQKSGLNRNILDVAWGRFQTQLRYKAESAGGRVIEVPPHMTSQVCSGCGTVVRKSLSERTPFVRSGRRP